MSKPDDGEPAYPSTMSPRDWYAGMALNGMLGQHRGVYRIGVDGDEDSILIEPVYDVGEANVAADHARIYADAMIAESRREAGDD